MKIQPLDNIVQLEIEEAKAGALDVSSRQSATEFAEVVAVAEHYCCEEDVAKCKWWKLHPGDKVFVKSWAIDIISHEGHNYYFVNLKTDGILAIVKER